MHTILLTGFGPFPGVPKNPTQEVVARMDGAKLEYSGRQGVVRAVLLDVVWESGTAADGRLIRGAPDALRDAVAKLRPDLLVSMGVASREQSRFRIERRPTDIRVDEADAVGRKPTQRSQPTRELSTNLPGPWIIDQLARKGITMYESEDAGKYLCEAITFEGALLVAEKRSNLVMSGFVHVPNVYAVDEALQAGRITKEARAKLPTLDTIVEAMKVVLEISLYMIPSWAAPTTKGTAADQTKGTP